MNTDSPKNTSSFKGFYKKYGVGMRIAKTAIAVLICMVLASLLNQSPPFYACIAAVLSMQDTVENSVKFGLNRLIGTAVGGGVGIILIYSAKGVEVEFLYQLCIILSVMVSLYVCNIIKRQAAASASCIVLLSIVLNHQDGSLEFALMRIGETALGIIISLVVNRLINPTKNKKLPTNKGEELKEDITSA